MNYPIAGTKTGRLSSTVNIQNLMPCNHIGFVYDKGASHETNTKSSYDIALKCVNGRFVELLALNGKEVAGVLVINSRQPELITDKLTYFKRTNCLKGTHKTFTLGKADGHNYAEIVAIRDNEISPYDPFEL